MKRVTYIISEIDRAIMFEWIVEMLDTSEFQLSFILMNASDSYFEDYLRKKNLEVHRVKFSTKLDWIRCVFQVRKILKKIKPEVVHTHFFDATVVGLFSARLLSISKRVYTRHHSDLHHTYFKKGIVLDWFNNRMATQIIAISGMVKTILEKWEKVPLRKIVLIPHGINVSDFQEVAAERAQKFREQYCLDEDSFIVGVISRFTEWKGIQYIIPAFKKFVETYPDSILLMLNAHGDFENEIRRLLLEVPTRNYRLIRFERDIPAAYKCFDVFVHVPVDPYCEAFGLIYIEALAATVPSIFTLSGIAPDFIRNNENAVVVPFRDSDSIHEKLVEIKTNKCLRERIIKNGFDDVVSKFKISQTIDQLERLYNETF